MHKVRLGFLIFFGIWAYAVIGARLGWDLVQEFAGLKEDSWITRLLILLLWPILEIVRFFEG